MKTTKKSYTGLLAVSAVLLAPACSGVDPPFEGSAPATGTATSTTSPDEFPTVLSTSTADSGRTVTATELAAELAANNTPRPEGFRDLSVVVAGGLGSFTVAVPGTYSVLWRAGTSPEELLAEASRRDPSWARYARPRLTNAPPDGGLRAIVLDTAPSDEARALFVTLSRTTGQSGDALAEAQRQKLTDDGQVVNEAHGVQVNGADGAYFEFATAAPPGGREPRVVMQVLIPDPPNDLLWGLSCEVPESGRVEVKPVCAEIAATFQPLPRVDG